MVDPRPLNRQQLSAFLKDPESIRRFERLFEIVGQVTPEQLRALAILIEEVGIEATNASAKANSALSLIDNLDNDVIENLGLKALNEIEALKSEVSPRYTPKNEDYIDFPIAPYVEQDRRLAWDNENLTLTMGLVNYQLKIGQNTIFCVKNVSGATINKGQTIMATGVLGASAKIEAGLAIADGSINAMMMLGVAAQDIANNAFGYVTQFGKVRGFNTTGAAYGETWADGDVLYFNPNVAGGLTNVAPAAPDLNLPIAYVLNASVGSGSIFVRMKQGEYLNELHDVAITSPVANQALIYDGTIWENTTLKTVNGNSLIGSGDISAGGGINLGTVVTLTTQTSVDFTGIPSGVKRITLAFNGLSTNGTSNPIIQLGDSGGIEATGYLGTSGFLTATQGVSMFTNGLNFSATGWVAASVLHGIINIVLIDSSTNTWAMNLIAGNSNVAALYFGGASKSLSDVLTQVRLTTAGGVNQFDAGKIQIYWES